MSATPKPVFTLFSDVSYFQKDPDNTYPHRFLSIRSNDGDFKDPSFLSKLRWAVLSINVRRLLGVGIYYVYHPGGSGIAGLAAQEGAARGIWKRRKWYRVFVIIDVESWKGTIRGDHSAEILAEREKIARELNSFRPKIFQKRLLQRDRKRVLLYGNQNDLETICPNRGDALIDLANFSGNPYFPNKVVHQFTDKANVPPFGPSDLNSADGLTPRQFAAKIGLINPLVVKKPKPPKPVPPPVPVPPTPKPPACLHCPIHCPKSSK